MPSIAFTLSQACHQYNSSIDEDSFSMSVSGQCIKPWHQKYFTIFDEGRELDGFGSLASISVIPRDSRAEVPGIPTDSPKNSADGHRDFISVSVYSNDVSFELSLALPEDTYSRLKNVNWSIENVELTISNGMFGHSSNALIYGNDPDGHEIEWHVDRQKYQFIEDFYIRFFPISNNNFDYPKNTRLINEHFEKIYDIISEKEEKVFQNINKINQNIYELSKILDRSAVGLAIFILLSAACISYFL